MTTPLPVVLVTGASGFVGQALCCELADRGHIVHAAVRSTESLPTLNHEAIRWVATGDLSPSTDWQAVLSAFVQDHPEEPHCIIHCAARAHVMNEAVDDALSRYRDMNTGVTRGLAEQAARAGVTRLVFLSSIKVNGEKTEPGKPFRHDDPPRPEDPYGVSKWEAEQELWKIAKSTNLQVTVVRPPLVYGPGVKGNLLRVMGLVAKGLPLPLGSINNHRSMIGLDNLVDLLIHCATSPKANGQTLLACDNEDLSTPDLFRMVSNTMQRKSRLLSVPVFSLKLLGTLTGKKAEIDRLTDSLQIDGTHTQQVLGWQPPVDVRTGIQAMVQWYQQRSASSTVSSGAASVHQPQPKLMRLFDILFASLGLLALSPVLLVLLVLGWLDTRHPLFTQQRVGRHQKPFTLVKFRTMRPDTASVATHLADASAVTPLGKFLRRSKLDELPQLWNVLKGEMSLVGPRPCLFNQVELIEQRAKRGVFDVRPGITGLAQTRDIDMSTPELLAQTDAKMIETLTLKDYFGYILATALGRGAGDRVKRD